MSWATHWAATFVMITIGCGGKVEQRRDNQGGSGGGGDQAWGNDPVLGGDDGPKGRLGDCVPGTPVHSTTSCLWYAKQTCYSTKEAACNCICPLDVGEVVCASAFQEEGLPTEVFCNGL